MIQSPTLGAKARLFVSTLASSRASPCLLLHLFGIDAKTVTTLFGTTLYIFFFISYKTRKIHHFNITAHPTVKWLEQQLSNFTYDLNDKVYLIRDGDQLYKYVDFKKYDITDVKISYQAPNMNAITERFIGSFNRNALNKFVIFNENQLRNIIKEYVTYYNLYRPHQGIGNITIPKYENKNDNEIKIYHKKPKGKILRKKFLGGILNHYYYEDVAA